jgi:hypothetical protein
MGDNYFPAPNSDGVTVDSIACAVAHFDYHIHSHLSIFVNGRHLAVPAAIGIKNPHFITTTDYPDGFASYGDCVYSLHTHDTSGKLHVESATPQTFTLGEFFHVWRQPLTRQNVAGITAQPLVIYINDGTNLRVYNGDPAAIDLVSKREITFQFGTPLTQIPTYIWYGEGDQDGEHEAVTAARIQELKAKR